MALVKTILALLLAGTMIFAASALIFILFYAWTIGQWGWTVLAFIALALWIWRTGGKKGEDRNDYGV